MTFQFIYIIIGLGSLIINIILLGLYYKLNFSGLPGKLQKKNKEGQVSEVKEPIVMDSFDNTVAITKPENASSADSK